MKKGLPWAFFLLQKRTPASLGFHDNRSNNRNEFVSLLDQRIEPAPWYKTTFGHQLEPVKTFARFFLRHSVLVNEIGASLAGYRFLQVRTDRGCRTQILFCQQPARTIFLLVQKTVEFHRSKCILEGSPPNISRPTLRLFFILHPSHFILHFISSIRICLMTTGSRGLSRRSRLTMEILVATC